MAVIALVAGNDALDVLPTGYGESLIHKCLFEPKTLKWRLEGPSCNFSVKKHHPGSVARDRSAGLSCR